jgi:hypothetical protein
MTEWAKDRYEELVYNEEAREKWLREYRDTSVQGAEGEGRIDVRAMAQDLIDAIIRERGFYAGSITDMPPFDVVQEMVRQSMLNMIDVTMPRFEDATWEQLQTYFAAQGRPVSTLAELRQTPEYQAVLNEDAERINELPDGLVADLRSGIEGGEKKKLRDVEDPLRSQIEQEMVSRYPQQFKLEELRTGQVDFEAYFPRNGYPGSILKELKKRKVEEAKAQGADEATITQKELEVEVALGRRMSEDLGLSAEYGEPLVKASLTRGDLENPSWGYKPGHLMSRGAHTEEGDPLPGYDKSVEALTRYQQSMANGISNVFGAFLRSEATRAFEDAQVMGDDTEAWATFMRVYNRDLMGAPGVFPPKWAEKVGGTVGPYFAFTDNPIREKVAALADRMGFNGDYFRGDDTGQEGRKRAIWAEKAQRFSKWEGQWNLMTLLANFETPLTNLFDGSKNAIINSGFRYWRAATRRDVNEWRYRVDPNFESKDDIRRFFVKHGAQENYLINEIRGLDWIDRLSGESLRTREFIDDVLQKIRKDPDTDDAWIKSKFLEKLTGVENRARAEQAWKAFVEAGGWFMRAPERKLRQDTWGAHYLKARETLWMNGQTFDADHPWLIDMANRGVEATQFLYNNSERPAFARTAVGRIFSRFQLYTWNAIRFRRDVFGQAQEMGYDPGTKEYARLARMMQADLFVLGLASLLPWSLFANAVPPPFQEFKELAKLFFGDDEERKRAFFGGDWGVLNQAKFLKAVAPPSSRVPESIFRLMLTGDWQQFTGYAIHTWYPFGRLTKDALRSMKHPTTATESLLGVPLVTLEGALNDPPGEGAGFASAPTDDSFDVAELMGNGQLPASPSQASRFQQQPTLSLTDTP